MVFTAEKRILPGLLLGAIGLLAAGCARHAAPAPPKPAVTVVDLHARPVSLTTELPGRVSAYRIAEVRPQVNGVILKRLFNEGDLVGAGQQLYQIDPAPYQAALASARQSSACACLGHCSQADRGALPGALRGARSESSGLRQRSRDAGAG